MQAKAKQRLTCEACTTLNEHERKRSANLEVGQKLRDESESKTKLESEARSFSEINESKRRRSSNLAKRTSLESMILYEVLKVLVYKQELGIRI